MCQRVYGGCILDMVTYFYVVFLEEEDDSDIVLKRDDVGLWKGFERGHVCFRCL